MRAAAVDIGSNTLRLLVRDDAPELERRTDVVGLGTGVDASGLLSDAAMERAAAVLAEYGVRIRELRVERARAVATFGESRRQQRRNVSRSDCIAARYAS